MPKYGNIFSNNISGTKTKSKMTIPPIRSKKRQSLNKNFNLESQYKYNKEKKNSHIQIKT